MIELDSPETCRVESQLALQLLMDRVLKKMLENKVNVVTVNDGGAVAPLTVREQSAIHYMAGYVAFKLLKRYGKPSTHPQVQLKRSCFVRILKGMSAAGQQDTIESLLDYTHLWSELIERGGLFHINDKVCTMLTKFTIVLVYQ